MESWDEVRTAYQVARVGTVQRPPRAGLDGGLKPRATFPAMRSFARFFAYFWISPPLAAGEA